MASADELVARLTRTLVRQAEAMERQAAAIDRLAQSNELLAAAIRFAIEADDTQAQDVGIDEARAVERYMDGTPIG